MNSYRVGIAGFGAIGQAVAQSLDAGLPGLTLTAVAVRDPNAPPAFSWTQAAPRYTTIDGLHEHCDVVVECAPAAVFRDIAEPVLRAGKKMVVLSSGALLRHDDLIELARMRQSLCLIVSPRHPLANRDHCSVKDLAGLRVVVPDPSFGIRQELDRTCATNKVELEICNETNSLAFAQTLAARTELATFLPRDSAMPSLQAGLLVAVPLRDARLEATQVTLVQPAARNMSPSGRLVADLLVGRMKAMKD